MKVGVGISADLLDAAAPVGSGGAQFLSLSKQFCDIVYNNVEYIRLE